LLSFAGDEEGEELDTHEVLFKQKSIVRPDPYLQELRMLPSILSVVSSLFDWPLRSLTKAVQQAQLRVASFLQNPATSYQQRD
jgi:hypothetical protein